MAAGLVIPRGSAYGFANRFMRFDSNDTFIATDIVNVEAGQVQIAGTGDFIAGIAMEAATASSSDVKVNVTPGLRLVLDNDNDSTTFAATHVGQRFDIAGDTGAQIVDTSSAQNTYTGPAGQLLCIAYNPQDIRPDLDSDTSVGLFIVMEQQTF